MGYGLIGTVSNLSLREYLFKLPIPCVSRVTFVPTVGYEHPFEENKIHGYFFQTLEVNADL